SVPGAPCAAVPPALGPSPPRTFWPAIGDSAIWGVCGTCSPKAGSLLGPGPATPDPAPVAGIRGSVVWSAPSPGEPFAGPALPFDFPRTGSAVVESPVAAGVPAPAAGVKEGEAGSDGDRGENLGMRAAVLAGAPGPDA